MPLRPGVLSLRHLRGDQTRETEMHTFKLQRLAFGSAKSLTRDGLIGEFTEKEVRDSEYPPMG